MIHATFLGSSPYSVPVPVARSFGASGKMLIAYPLFAPYSYCPPLLPTRFHEGHPQRFELRSRIVPIHSGSTDVPKSPWVAYVLPPVFSGSFPHVPLKFISFSRYALPVALST